MATLTLSHGIVVDSSSQKGFYDQRRAFGPVLSIDDVLETPVFDEELRSLRLSAKGQERLAVDKSPLPAPSDREGYFGDRHLEYWLSGLRDAELLIANCDNGKTGKKYLDFGGCSGRVARHFIGRGDWEPWVCDINVNYSDWIEHYLPGVRAFQNRPFPHLPYTDGFFDAVSAFSVFTHLDNEEIPWLLELKRVVAPGGFLYLTIMDEFCWDKTRDHEWLLESIGSGGNQAGLREALTKGGIPAERFILKYHDGDAYNVNVFLKREYIRSRWGRFLEIIDILPGAHNHQTVLERVDIHFVQMNALTRASMDMKALGVCS